MKQVIDTSRSEAVENSPSSKFVPKSKKSKINSDDPFGDGIDEMNELSYSETVGEMKREFDQIKEIISALCGDVEFLMSEEVPRQ